MCELFVDINCHIPKQKQTITKSSPKLSFIKVGRFIGLMVSNDTLMNNFFQGSENSSHTLFYYVKVVWI